MIGKMIILKTNGTKEIKNYSAAVPLEDIQAAVGGYAEWLPTIKEFEGQPACVYCDEEGKFKSYKPNPFMRVHNDIVILGDISVVTGDSEFMESHLRG